MTPTDLPSPSCGFEEVPHTADWAYRIWAPDYPGLFVQAGQGLYALVKAELVTVPRVSRRLELRALDYESLLIAWLNELLFLHESENLGFDEWDITDLDPQHLLATLRGAALQAWEKDVKAATYHNLSIVATAKGLEATVVLDV
jgi:SHS2 domain-containing protein